MNKWLLSILFICCVVAGCTKSTGDLEKYKAQAAIDDKIIANYITANNLTGKMLKTSDTSGVYYQIIKKGIGSDLYTLSTQVTVSDTGRGMISGKVFYQTNDFHPSYILQQTILGWQLGIPKINKGGIVRLLIPSRYAYGPSKQQQIGIDTANAILDFTIQVYNITN
ncbi:MAG TPA: FKBP-type peptidyl-prolyl cis-trans isomerase [Mucilaginibacter sp.]|jgi:FKBP-type peptidyl-prolyl cis-trans isomerase FkpA